MVENFNENDVREFYRWLSHQKETEIRLLDIKGEKQPISVFTHSEGEFVENCRKYNGKYNIYAGLNERSKDGTKAEDVVAVRNVAFDIDSRHKPATEKDLEQVNFSVANIVKDNYDEDLGMPLVVESGNGYWLFYAIPEIEITDDNRTKIENKIQELHRRLKEEFSNASTEIDNVGDLPRIVRVAGTKNLKGGNIAKIVQHNKRIENEKLLQVILDIEEKEATVGGKLDSKTTDILKNDETIWRLFNGDCKGFVSRSEAEQSLVCRLIKSNFDKKQIFKVMANCKIGKWQEAHLQYRELTYKKAMEIITDEKKKKNNESNKAVSSNKKKIQGEILFFREAQVEKFWENQPFFYDKSKIFYLWNKKLKRWEISDEVDFLNSIRKELGIDTIDSKIKNELIEGFKQVGRRHEPKKTKKTWVQFKDKIYDGITGDFLFDAAPEYFVKNPIPYKLGKSTETPKIDKLFNDWVGKEDKIRLYELFAYSMVPDRFMQRIFALCGGGSNGKGTCINELLVKFLGKDNAISTEMRELSENQFETAVLYGKLLCIMGEVNYGDLRNTNQLKKLSGEDLIRFCFKGKTPFTDDNTALCVCLTNALPTTPDKSLGFYRKWNIIDFPNQFPEIKKNIIGEIPEEEFENLALKSLNTLKELYKNPKFTNEGDFEERIKRYEERSNPVMKFIEERCDEEEGHNIPLRKFTNDCNGYLKNKHLRILTAHQIGRILRDEGFMIGKVTTGDTSITSIKNLMFKSAKNKGDKPQIIENTKNTKNTNNRHSFIHGNSMSHLGIFGISDTDNNKKGSDKKEIVVKEQFDKKKRGKIEPIEESQENVFLGEEKVGE